MMGVMNMFLALARILILGTSISTDVPGTQPFPRGRLHDN